MWSQILNALIGIWLMVAPPLLHYSLSGSISCRIVGPILATFAIVACWEITRGVGKVAMLLGLWLLVAPWILGYTEILPIVNDTTSGILVISFAFVKSEIKNNYGGGWKSLWTTSPGINLD